MMAAPAAALEPVEFEWGRTPISRHSVPYTPTGIPLSGGFNALFEGTSGYVRRQGAVLVAASPFPMEKPLFEAYADYRPGDEVVIRDTSGQEHAYAFPGYPIVNRITCASKTVTGTLLSTQVISYASSTNEANSAFPKPPPPIIHLAGTSFSVTYSKPITAVNTAAVLVRDPSLGVAVLLQLGCAAPLRCRVPELKGRTVRQAQELLLRAQCKVGRITKARPTRTAPRVVRQHPAAHTILSPGSAVDIRVR